MDLRAWIERCCYPLLSPTWSQRWYPIGGKYYYQRQQNIFINIIIILVNSNMNSIRQMLTKSKLLFLPVNIIVICVINVKNWDKTKAAILRSVQRMRSYWLLSWEHIYSMHSCSNKKFKVHAQWRRNILRWIPCMS